MPASAGRICVPLAMMQFPFLTSSPWGRIFPPRSTSLKILTESSEGSVSSTFTTVSAPFGMGAPVMIRMAWPRPTALAGTLPAGTSSITFNTIGLVMACSCLISSQRTANPSMAELSHGGLSLGAMMSSASTRPSASSSPTFSIASG